MLDANARPKKRRPEIHCSPQRVRTVGTTQKLQQNVAGHSLRAFVGDASNVQELGLRRNSQAAPVDGFED